MLDNLTLVDRCKLKWNLAISTEFALQYIKQDSRRRIVLCGDTLATIVFVQ
jgi:hypothetical protein